MLGSKGIVLKCTAAIFSVQRIRHFRKRRELGRVNIRKDFWDCCQGHGASPVTIPERIAVPPPFSCLKWQLGINVFHVCANDVIEYNVLWPILVLLFFSFQTSLASLMTTLGQSHPYFVRCVKPNEKKVCPAVSAFFSLATWLKVWMGEPRWVRKWPLSLWENVLFGNKSNEMKFWAVFCIDLDSIST